MIIYWSACFLSIILALIVTRDYTFAGHELQGRVYCFIAILLAALPFIYIAAVRYNVGADFQSYYKYYLNILEGRRYNAYTGIFTRKRGQYEILFYLANLFIASLHLSAPWILALTAILFLMPVYKRIFTDSPYPAMSIFLLMAMGYYCYFLNGTRQMIGAAFLMLSIPFIEKKKFIPFLILVLIATGFHTTCIVFLAVYILAHVNISIKVISAVTVILFVFGNLFGNIANNFLSELEYYSGYLNSSYAQRGQGYIILTINIVLVVFSTIFFQKDNKLYQIYYGIQVLALWAAALTGKIVLVNRYTITFGLFSIILLPMTLSGIGDQHTRRFLSMAVVVLYFIYATYTIGFQNANTVLPYQTYWQAGIIQ